MQRLLWFPLLCWLVVGCSVSYEARSLRDIAKPASTQVDHVEKQGLCVVARKLDRQESVTYLGLNVHDRGYAPVLAEFENTGDREISLPQQQIQMVTEQGDQLQMLAAEQMAATLSYSHAPPLLWLIIIIPGVFIAVDGYQSVSLANELMAEDYDRKVFKTNGYLLKPKSRQSTIMFFPTPALDNKFDYLTIEAKRLGATEAEFTKQIKMNVPVK